jgi:hypothetical protein
VADVLEFTTKPKTDADGDTGEPEPFVFKLDGVELTAIKPKDALIAQLAPISHRRTPRARKVQLALDFLGDCIVEPGRSHLEERLLSPDDELDADDVLPILGAIGDYWKAHAKAQKKK